MTIFNFLTLLGGLALTLYGMNVMGNGLTKTSGGKLEAILEKFAGNPFKGLLFGAIVTAVVQSSSATTVMVVGFVNSGIMKLTQAVGIIMVTGDDQHLQRQFPDSDAQADVVCADTGCNRHRLHHVLQKREKEASWRCLPRIHHPDDRYVDDERRSCTACERT